MLRGRSRLGELVRHRGNRDACATSAPGRRKRPRAAQNTSSDTLPARAPPARALLSVSRNTGPGITVDGSATFIDIAAAIAAAGEPAFTSWRITPRPAEDSAKGTPADYGSGKGPQA